MLEGNDIVAVRKVHRHCSWRGRTLANRIILVNAIFGGEFDTMLTLKAGSACVQPFRTTRPSRVSSQVAVVPSFNNVVSGISVGQRADGRLPTARRPG
jgi:metallophosphoesterase superfamily enzyme